jgi:EpsI family protein
MNAAPKFGDWRRAAVAYLAALILLAAANRTTLAAWIRQWPLETHYYEFAVVAIAAWLLWRCRGDLASETPRPDWRALPVVTTLAAALWLAYLIDLRLAELALLIAAAIVLAWAVYGAKVARILAYPLAFLLLALPFWAYFQPTLQNLTVAATAGALRAAGVPVFVDSTYIQVPQGTVNVLTECSGSQFFQAGVTLGALYAYLAVRRAWTRIVVLASFAIVAIVGNWIRVSALIFSGRLSDIEHLNVGWGVFAVTMLPLLWFVVRLQKYDQPPAPTPLRRSHAESIASAPTLTRLAATTSIAVALLVGPAALRNGPALDGHTAVDLAPMQASSPWSGPFEAAGGWRPQLQYPDAAAHSAYRLGAHSVAMYWAYFSPQAQGHEVINDRNSMYDARDWRPRAGNGETTYKAVTLPDGTTFTVAETRLEHRDTRAERLVWHWYSVAGREVARPIYAKLAQIAGAIAGRRDAWVIVLSTDVRDIADARATLANFVQSNIAAIRSFERTQPPSPTPRIARVASKRDVATAPCCRATASLAARGLS